MSLEEREGVVERLTERGLWLSGTHLVYSKWYDGDRLSEEDVGRSVSVVVDVSNGREYLKRVKALGEKSPDWKPPERPPNKGFFPGPGRRMSPEELTLKRDEGVRIARSVAIDRAITLADRGITVEKIAPHARAVEEYLLTGRLPTEASASGNGTPKEVPPAEPHPRSPAPAPPPEDPPGPPAPSARKGATEPPTQAVSRSRRLPSLAVNDLFNEAKRAGLVADWKDYLSLIEGVLKAKAKSAYHLSREEFAKVESHVRARLAGSKVA